MGDGSSYFLSSGLCYVMGVSPRSKFKLGFQNFIIALTTKQLIDHIVLDNKRKMVCSRLVSRLGRRAVSLPVHQIARSSPSGYVNPVFRRSMLTKSRANQGKVLMVLYPVSCSEAPIPTPSIKHSSRHEADFPALLVKNNRAASTPRISQSSWGVWRMSLVSEGGLRNGDTRLSPRPTKIARVPSLTRSLKMPRSSSPLLMCVSFVRF